MMTRLSYVIIGLKSCPVRYRPGLSSRRIYFGLEDCPAKPIASLVLRAESLPASARYRHRRRHRYIDNDIFIDRYIDIVRAPRVYRLKRKRHLFAMTMNLVVTCHKLDGVDEDFELRWCGKVRDLARQVSERWCIPVKQLQFLHGNRRLRSFDELGLYARGQSAASWVTRPVPRQNMAVVLTVVVLDPFMPRAEPPCSCDFCQRMEAS